jgi:hypothetical protein
MHVRSDAFDACAIDPSSPALLRTFSHESRPTVASEEAPIVLQMMYLTFLALDIESSFFTDG